MRSAIAAELAKIFTTRLWWGLLAGALGLVALTVVLTVFSSGQPGAVSIETPEGARNVVAGIGSAYLFSLVLGIMGMAGEYRHQTITASLLAVPRRWSLVAAKLVAHAVVGLLYAVVSVGVGLAIALPLLTARGADLGHLDLQVQVAGLLAGVTLYAVIGVAIGALVRNQVAAIIGTLLWVMILEALLVNLLPEIGKWLPGGAANAMLQTAVLRGELLPLWGGAALFLAYAAALAAAGAFTTVRRDVA